MALSSSESALLTQTCENMNVAANTCREVLEMLRSLGNTGVVDIATHNNATTAHANATNLAHQDQTHGIYNGNLGVSNIFPNYYPIQINGAGSSPAMFMISQTKGTDRPSGFFEIYKALSDSNEQLIEFDGASAALGNVSYIRLMNLSGIATGLESGTKKNVVCGISFFGGTYNHVGDFKYTFIRVNLANNGTSAGYYDFAPDAFMPAVGATVSLGVSGTPWDTAYLRTAATITSDRREKSSVSALDTKAVDFLKALRPVQFTVKVGKQNVLEADEMGTPTNVETIAGTRRHWGLVAQEVQEALASAGYDPSACAVWSLADKDDPDSKQALRYEELIAPIIKVIQSQQERIEALERKVA